MINKILYPCLALLSGLYFAFGIDIYTFTNFNTPLTIFGTLLTTGLLYLSVRAWTPKNEHEATELKYHAEKTGDDNGYGCLILIGLGVFMIVYGWFLYGHATALREKEIDEKGVFTFATVTDGLSAYGGTSSETYVIIEYTDKDGKEHKSRADIGAGEFDNYGKGQEVGILYMPQHPDVIRILKSGAEINKYTKNEYRELKFDDLIKLLSTNPGKETVDYLNSVSLKWEGYPSGEGSYTYSNSMKEIGIKTGNGSVVYMHSTFDQHLFDNELTRAGYKQKREIASTYYTNGEYMVLVSGKPVKQQLDPRDSRTFAVDKMITIVTIARLSQ